MSKAAAALADAGLAVFPLRRNDKRPLHKGWQDEATTDKSDAREMFRDEPRVNIGVATGPASNVFVLDVDVKAGAPGKSSMARLQKEIGKLTDTATVQTASGGLHLYYDYNRDDIGNSAGTLAPGLDGRGKGGYVVAPPSVVDGHAYTWLRELDSIRKLPSALRERLLVPRSASEEPGDGAPALAEPIAKGRRNQTLYRTACALRNQGLDADHILGAIDYVNKEQCDPPLPRSELRLIVQSACKHKKGTGEALPEELEAQREFRIDKVRETVQDLLQRDIPPIEYLFDDWIARGASSVLSGPPKGYKSTLIIDRMLVLAGAKEESWNTLKATTGERFRIGYLDLEQADALFQERIAELKPTKPKALRRILRLNDFPKFTAEGLDQLERFIRSERLQFCIVDTAAAVRPDQRHVSVMQADRSLFEPITKIAHRTGCHICILYHNNKVLDEANPMNMIAATNALAGAVDDIFVISKPRNPEHETRRNLYVTGRHIRHPGTYVLDRVQGGVELVGEATHVVQGELQRNVLEFMRAAPNKQWSALTIAKSIGGTNQNGVTKVLWKLMDRGLVVQPARGTWVLPTSALGRGGVNNAR